MRVNGQSQNVHRLVCETEHGPAPFGYEAAHSCGNGHLGCVNRNHLSWKTRAGNAADMVAHGTSAKGEGHGLAKLTEDAVREIRRFGTSDRRSLADRFSVCAHTIGEIQRGDTWAWLK